MTSVKLMRIFVVLKQTFYCLEVEVKIRDIFRLILGDVGEIAMQRFQEI